MLITNTRFLILPNPVFFHYSLTSDIRPPLQYSSSSLLPSLVSNRCFARTSTTQPPFHRFKSIFCSVRSSSPICGFRASVASTLLFAQLWPLLFSSRRAGAFLVPLLYFVDLVWAFNLLLDYGLDMCFPIVGFFDLGILTNFGRDLSYSVGSVPPFLALFFSVHGPFCV